MLFKVLKLFGLDVPAKVEAARFSLEQRIDEAKDHVKQVAQQAAAIAAFSALAGIAGAFALGIGLLALYWWTAENYGPFIGLAVVGGLLLAAAVAFAAAAASKSKSMASGAPIRASHPTTLVAEQTVGATTAAGYTPDRPVSVSAAVAAPSLPPDWPPPAALVSAAEARASARDLAEPLGYILSKFVKYPSVGNPIVDELIGNLKVTAQGATGDAIERAAEVVRRGDRVNLVLVLGGAAFVGWLLAHQQQRQ